MVNSTGQTSVPTGVMKVKLAILTAYLILSLLCKSMDWFLYDNSLRHERVKGEIADRTKQQICAILNCDLKHVKINILPVQQQRNEVDCGVFALASWVHIL